MSLINPTPSNTPSNTPTITPSSTNCPSLTPTPSPSPVYKCKCIKFTNPTDMKYGAAYTNCNGVPDIKLTVVGGETIEVCGSNPVADAQIIIDETTFDCIDGSCPSYSEVYEMYSGMTSCDGCVRTSGVITVYYVGNNVTPQVGDFFYLDANITTPVPDGFYVIGDGAWWQVTGGEGEITAEDPTGCIDDGCVTPTPTQTPTMTPTPTNTQTPTQTGTPTNTPTNTGTPTNTPTNTLTASPTRTPTQTPSNTPSGSPAPLPCQTFQFCSPSTSGEFLIGSYIDCNNVYNEIYMAWNTGCIQVCGKQFTITDYGVTGSASVISPTCI